MLLIKNFKKIVINIFISLVLVSIISNSVVAMGMGIIEFQAQLDKFNKKRTNEIKFNINLAGIDLTNKYNALAAVLINWENIRLVIEQRGDDNPLSFDDPLDRMIIYAAAARGYRMDEYGYRDYPLNFTEEPLVNSLLEITHSKRVVCYKPRSEAIEEATNAAIRSLDIRKYIRGEYDVSLTKAALSEETLDGMMEVIRAMPDDLDSFDNETVLDGIIIATLQHEGRTLLNYDYTFRDDIFKLLIDHKVIENYEVYHGLQILAAFANMLDTIYFSGSDANKFLISSPVINSLFVQHNNWSRQAEILTLTQHVNNNDNASSLGVDSPLHYLGVTLYEIGDLLAPGLDDADADYRPLATARRFHNTLVNLPEFPIEMFNRLVNVFVPRTDVVENDTRERRNSLSLIDELSLSPSPDSTSDFEYYSY